MKIKMVTIMKADQFFLQAARVGQRLQPPTFLQDCEQKPPGYGELVCIYNLSCYLNENIFVYVVSTHRGGPPLGNFYHIIPFFLFLH